MIDPQYPSESCAPKLRLAGVIRESIVDGPGLRFTIFSQGCPHHCPGCHNPESHEFAGGYEQDLDKILEAIDENPLLQGVTFSGGEPTCQPAAFLYLARACKERKLNIWMFSGYRLEELIRRAENDPELRELLYWIDVLVDGRYEHGQRDLTLQYRGSRNQRLIDMNQTFTQGRIVEYVDPWNKL